jgi:CBS domain-containing protein
MTSDPLVLKEECDVARALELMSHRAVRRAPVVGAGGELVGIVSFDDLVPQLARQMSTIASLISGQVERRRHRW